LGRARVDEWDPVVFVCHLTCPQIEFTNRGKTQASLPPAVREDMAKAISRATRKWSKAKRKSERVDRRERDAMLRVERPRMTIKDAVHAVLSEAYDKVSDGGRYPANARQLMYACRPAVQELTGGKLWSNDAYFTQTLLPDFLKACPDLTGKWDVVYDDRGHLTEPHTGHAIGLGTLAVRRYLRESNVTHADGRPLISTSFPTRGPKRRYNAVLFLEKEGFDSLLSSARIAERYDIARMSSKGMSVVSARQLVDSLSAQGIPILVAHDFDKAGFSIFSTLGTDTRRYTFESEPHVIDIGLRLQDVEAMGLDSEGVTYKDQKDPRHNLRENGATGDECSFLVEGQRGCRWHGRRVELNAMTSKQMLTWLEDKLQEHGVEKVVPDEATLAETYRRAVRLAEMQAAIDEIAARDDSDVQIPTGLAAMVRARLEEDRAAPWDRVVADIAREGRT